MALHFSEQEMAQVSRFNGLLRRLPRLRLRGWWDYLLINGVMGLVQLLLRILRGPRGIVKRRVGLSPDRTVKVRIMRPAGKCRGVLLDLHGGAWVVGSAAMDDLPNLEIARECNFAVVSVDYRLADRYPFETMLEDCKTAALWLLESSQAEFATDKIFIGGESAGAYLAVQTLLGLRQLGLADRIVGALLQYGVYDLAGTPSLLKAGRDAMVLHLPDVRNLAFKLFPGKSAEELRDPSLSPLYASLEGLPPALFVVGACDALRDDSRLLSSRWGAELFEVPDSPHGFNRFPTAVARKTRAYTWDWLKALR